MLGLLVVLGEAWRGKGKCRGSGEVLGVMNWWNWSGTPSNMFVCWCLWFVCVCVCVLRVFALSSFFTLFLPCAHCKLAKCYKQLYKKHQPSLSFSFSFFLSFCLSHIYQRICPCMEGKDSPPPHPFRSK